MGKAMERSWLDIHHLCGRIECMKRRVTTNDMYRVLRLSRLPPASLCTWQWSSNHLAMAMLFGGRSPATPVGGLGLH